MAKRYDASSFALTLLLSVGLILTCGCSDDDSSITGPGPGSVPGTWDLTGIRSQVGSFTYVVPHEEIDADPASRYFDGNGTGIEYYQGRETPFTWSTTGSTLTLAYSMETLVFTYSVNATTLTLAFDVEDEGVVYRITHTWTRR